ncbi:16S rRNA (cytidine(1402)-2'-O)-methyltransferase [Polynucleobacter wuianus]|uniref:Ribosomal RNA small subunit methyltransferase I n=1 Tax=Polynucleobacter wuianus TaxID=1743168 RepID=A0A191UI01_9BURK|nr:MULTISPECIES: 16S rRNA (cytidine(1402)-2'-O)-methyltransferase [Polynucleobacter]ANJ00639.1 16S rRNA (cytidine(1402)-2'-O)-methyltransferase [Polynucleobacter wuianus]MBU3553822.1 16S rRNA (cytidine(1402)-2'-O)-methyltransferase [Polynucleobacter sp. MWH-Post4-6-1]
MKLGTFDFLKQQDLPAGSLYMVATPIGNLGDITLRALHVLNAMDGIACEDTRHSAALLQQFDIHKKCLALHTHNELGGAQTVIQHLRNNERWAYISDAGTPGVSDPGARLVDEVQKAGFRVIPIPGASAVSCAISASGSVMFNSDGQFQFLGFWPHKTKERDALLQDIANSKKTSVFFESPHHIRETLLLLANNLERGRQVFICRELTKKFEQLVSIQAQEISSWIENAESLKGEFIILVSGRHTSADEAPEHATLMRWATALSPYLGSKEIAAVLSQTLGLAKKDAYQIALDAKESGK